ncbi:MAG TPA: polysaccharide deacetylase family protein [Solirubrobacteraceae bacterium]
MLLCLPLLLVAVVPFADPPQKTVEVALQAPPRPKPKRDVALPKPAPGDTRGQAVDRLARMGAAVRSGGGRQRWVALTFDDGPGPYTARVLRELLRLRVPATFFQVGRMVLDFPGPAVLTRNTESVTIGDHTYSHALLTALDRRAQLREILIGAAALEHIGIPAPRLFRPPYGAWDADTRAVTRRRGMAIVLWNVDSRDYKRPGVKRIVRNVVDAVRPGSIVLMHDGGGERTQTIKAIAKIVYRLRRRGYTFVTVDKMIGGDPPRRRDDFGRIGRRLIGETRGG